MFDCQLFIGIPLTVSQQNELNLLSSSLRKLFIQENNSECLQQIVYGEHTYLGKFLGVQFELTSLKNMEIHIISMIKKLIPSFEEEKVSCVVLALSPI